MNNEIIEALKKNDRGFYALSDEEKRTFKEAYEAGACVYLRVDNMWDRDATFNPDKFEDYIYRIDRDWEPESKKRWMVYVGDTVMNGEVYCSDDIGYLWFNRCLSLHSNLYIEVTEQELPYLQNRPDGCVLKKVDKGEEYWSIDIDSSREGTWLPEVIDLWGIPVSDIISGHRWVNVEDKNTDTKEEVKVISTSALRKALNEIVDKLEAGNE